MLDEHAAHYAATAGDRPVVLRAIVHGAGPVRGVLADPAAEAGLIERLRRLAEDRGGFVWWADVQLALMPGDAAHHLVTAEPRAAALVGATQLARATAPTEILRRGSGAGRWPLPGGAAWTGLVTAGTSLGFDLLLADDETITGGDAAPVQPADGLAALEDRLDALEQRLRTLDLDGGPPTADHSPDRSADGEHDGQRRRARSIQPAGTDARSISAGPNGRQVEPADRPALQEDLEEDVEEDIAATEEQLAVARADEARLVAELDALEARAAARAGAAPGREGAAFDQLAEALRRRREAEVELDAATTTATVLRLGLERSIGSRPSWLRWVQPVALVVASAAVLVAVALLTSGVGRAGIGVALIALASAAAALFLPTRPLREPPDVARMRVRLERADADIRFWNEEVATQAEAAAATAATLGLPADAGEDDLRRLEPPDTGGLGIQASIAVHNRELQVARNRATAASGADRQPQPRVGRRRRRRRHRAEGGAAGTVSARALLVQERRGLVDELNRRHWMLDRLAVARWLLAPTPLRHPDDTEPPDTGGSGEHGAAAEPAIRVLVTPAE